MSEKPADISDLIPYNEEVIVIWSGGMDSTALIAMMIQSYNCEVYPLFVKRCQANYRFEKQAIEFYDKIFQQRLGLKYNPFWEIEVDIPPKAFKGKLPEKQSHVLRNSDIINQAVRYALYREVNWIAIGSVPSDKKGWNDSTIEYIQRKTEEVRAGTGNGNLQVSAPYLTLNYDKKQIVSWCEENNLDLSDTRSCFEDDELPCGKCDACIDRKEAFE
jgi:7-cyano-7-deazaguanine synthase